MNDFNNDLVGVHAVCKPSGFSFPADATAKERTFVIGTDPGYKRERHGRKVKGRWLVDDMPDTIDTYSIESITVNGKTIKRPDEKEYVEVDIVAEPVLLEGKNKPRGRQAWAKPVATTPAAVVGSVMNGIMHRHPAPPPELPIKNGTLHTAEEAGLSFAKPEPRKVAVIGNGMAVLSTAISTRPDIDISQPIAAPEPPPEPTVAGKLTAPPKGLTETQVADILRMWAAGNKLADIAEHCGDRQKSNRVRRILEAAGVYKKGQ